MVRSNNITLFIVAFLIGVGFPMVIQFLPELLHILPTYNSRDHLNGLYNYPSLPFGHGGVLPWIDHLEVHDDLAPFLDSDSSSTALHIRRQKAAKDVENSSIEAESMTFLRLALEMRHGGKDEKALKLFQQAFALNPTHPDILNHYGEFLEEHGKDVVQAEQLYSKALAVSPGHSRALVNQQRTLPIVDEMDENHLSRIDAKRNHLMAIPESDAALCRIKKEAYFLHIYHTVGLEGNTMSLMETRQIVETRLAVGGKSLIENNEVLGLDAALVYVNMTLVRKLGFLTIQDILDIHRRVMGFVDPLEAGQFRRTQVFVGDHVPPPPTEMPVLMQEFVTWLNSEDALRLHPIRYAALAHYKLVYIHPFTDGNGRTSRLLMNLILMRAGYPPVIIRKQDRLSYYKYLEMANAGDVRPFIRFIAACTEKTLDVYLFATKEYPVPALENQRDFLRPTIIV